MVANDPNIQKALLQFGANATKPYDVRTASPASQLLGAVQGSVEYLQGLRDADTKRQMAERGLQVTEGQLAVAQQGAATAEKRANTEEYGTKQGEVPYKQAYADYLRSKTQLERLRLGLEKSSKTQFDKNLFEAATTLTGDPLSFTDQKEFRIELFKNYNRLASVYGMPIAPTPLEYITDDAIAKSVNSPEAEAMFIKYYGTAGSNRLKAVRNAAAEAAVVQQPGIPQSAVGPKTVPGVGTALPPGAGAMYKAQAVQKRIETAGGVKPFKSSITASANKFGAVSPGSEQMVNALKDALPFVDENTKQLYNQYISELE